MKVTRKKSGIHRRSAIQQMSRDVVDTGSMLASDADTKSAEGTPSSIDTVTVCSHVAWEYYLA